ncbi:MAG: tRNA pseudouridine(55) synthase TruB [Ignavibacteriae bacterium]|nr:tRNA pseudouridine(55) synthase TruB [Ignavibacteriota bacterium]
MTTRVADLRHDLSVHEGEMLLVNKPRDWSSFDVVNKMRSIFHCERIGHAGTLDMKATGLLIVCTGKKTKELSQFQEMDKEYDVTVRLGERTESYDAETPVTESNSVDHLTEQDIRSAVQHFVGEQQQLPPMWSAAKVAGKRLYRYARKGIEVERKPRTVCVRSIQIKEIALPLLYMTVVCSKGTYVRTLVNDLGNALNVGAYVQELSRTRIGEYQLADAVTIEDMIVYRNERRN